MLSQTISGAVMTLFCAFPDWAALGLSQTISVCMSACENIQSPLLCINSWLEGLEIRVWGLGFGVIALQA